MDAEGEADVLFCADMVGGLHIAAPGVDAAHTAHSTADRHHSPDGNGQFLHMEGLLQLMGGVGNGGEMEGCVRLFQV